MLRVQAAAETFVRRGWETEVVVCDNNSTDRTAEIARAAGARVVFEPFNQIARARNTGARGLRAIVEGLMMDVMYDIPSIEGAKRVVVDKSTVEGSTVPAVEILKKSA